MRSNTLTRVSNNPGAVHFILTYPHLPDGRLDVGSPVQSVLVNAQRMYDAVTWDLHRYVEALRNPDEVTLRTQFERLMLSSWGIGEADNLVGMTEAEFSGLT